VLIEIHYLISDLKLYIIGKNISLSAKSDYCWSDLRKVHLQIIQTARFSTRFPSILNTKYVHYWLKGVHNGCVEFGNHKILLRYSWYLPGTASMVLCGRQRGVRKKWRIVGPWNRFTDRSGFAICSLDRWHGDICADREPIFTYYRRCWSSGESLWTLMGFLDEREAVQLFFRGASSVICLTIYETFIFIGGKIYMGKNGVSWFCRKNQWSILKSLDHYREIL